MQKRSGCGEGRSGASQQKAAAGSRNITVQHDASLRKQNDGSSGWSVSLPLLCGRNRYVNIIQASNQTAFLHIVVLAQPTRSLRSINAGLENGEVVEEAVAVLHSRKDQSRAAY